MNAMPQGNTVYFLQLDNNLVNETAIPLCCTARSPWALQVLLKTISVLIPKHYKMPKYKARFPQKTNLREEGVT